MKPSSKMSTETTGQEGNIKIQHKYDTFQKLTKDEAIADFEIQTKTIEMHPKHEFRQESIIQTFVNMLIIFHG